MSISRVAVERFSVVSSKPFAKVVASVDAVIGHPNMGELWKRAAAAKSHKEIEQLIHSALGPSGFMEFARFNHGQFIEREQGEGAPKILRLIMGNPLIMKEMAKHVPDAGSYAPVTVLIDERTDGVHLTYDLMDSYLASYGNLAALKVARDLDAKVQAVLESAAK
jgi:uncharacterized protein (DUF302 family)